VLFDAPAGFFELPVGTAHEHVHAGACTAFVVATTALIAVPGTGAIFVIKAVAIFAAA